MSTPEKPRPSLDDTLRAIDEAIDALAAKMAAQPECRRCARQALIDSELCAYHLQLDPRETMIEDLGVAPVAQPVVRDGNTFTVTTPGVYELTWNPGGSGEPSVAERALEAPPDPDWVTFEKPGHLPEKRQYVAYDEPVRTGWLERALRRLFGDGAS